MRSKDQTSLHLLLSTIVTMFGTILILAIISLSWELWMVPVILIGNTLVWCLHIGRIGSETFYKNLCAGLLMVGFFFFGVHTITLFDVPAIACMIILIFSMFDKKRLLYMTAALYALILLYHLLILRTITHDMGIQNIIRLGLGFIIVTGSMTIANYRIHRRLESRKMYENTLSQLEKSGRQNAEFLSNVSHELRTPINMVLGISEVILEKDISPEIRTDMQSIKMAGKRLSNQIVNMLDYTEIMEGTLTPAKEPYRIVSVFNDLITLTAMQGSSHQLEMVFDLDPKIPEVLIGDVEKITHILKIVVENSIKFTEKGGINVCIQFRRESYGGNLIIDISDTGIGMTESQIAQMCDDFYQAESGSSRFAGGLGLGLPIARGLLHAMGGFIHFDSQQQQGLQVHITIPQGVEKDVPSMKISTPVHLCIACYFRPEKYNSDEVKRYYDNLILHMMNGLNLEGYQAHNFEGLLKLLNTHPLTHVFIAQAEYEENRAYYEELANTLQVVIIAERDFTLVRHSKLMIIHKPFFALSVVNLLNGEVEENGFGEAQAAGRKPFSCDQVRVLAVDDEEMNLVVAKGVLGSYGIEVDTCLSGREAIERCASTNYDIVFLDHMMPGFDGVETLKQIRSLDNGKYKKLPIIALTANTISGAREMFRSEGFTEFIPKPIERPVLERVLRKVLPDSHVQYEEMPVTPEEVPLPDNTVSPHTLPPEKPDPDKYFKISGRRRTGKHVSEVDIPKATAPVYELPEPDNNGSDNRPAKHGKGEQRVLEIDIPKATAPVYEIPEIIPNGDIPKDRIPNGSVLKYRLPVLNITRGIIPRDIFSKYHVAGKKLLQIHLPYTRVQKEPIQEKSCSESDLPNDTVTEIRTQEENLPEDRLAETYPSGNEHGSYSEADSSQPFAPLSDIGVNIQLGLDYCCGEDEFYIEMLQMFYSQAAQKKAEIISLYDDGNWTDYTVKVHALKSTSLTIGAEQLAEQARLLEQAGKNNDLEYIRKNHPSLLRLYDKLCETIAEL